MTSTFDDRRSRRRICGDLMIFRGFMSKIFYSVWSAAFAMMPRRYPVSLLGAAPEKYANFFRGCHDDFYTHISRIHTGAEFDAQKVCRISMGGAAFLVVEIDMTYSNRRRSSPRQCIILTAAMKIVGVIYSLRAALSEQTYHSFFGGAAGC